MADLRARSLREPLSSKEEEKTEDPLIGSCADVGFALESHRGIDEKFSDSGQSALKAVVEKEIEKGIVVVSVF
jgi:hypothetical protein